MSKTTVSLNNIIKLLDSIKEKLESVSGLQLYEVFNEYEKEIKKLEEDIKHKIRLVQEKSDIEEPHEACKDNTQILEEKEKMEIIQVKETDFKPLTECLSEYKINNWEIRIFEHHKPATGFFNGFDFGVCNYKLGEGFNQEEEDGSLKVYSMYGLQNIETVINNINNYFKELYNEVIE